MPKIKKYDLLGIILVFIISMIVASFRLKVLKGASVLKAVTCVWVELFVFTSITLVFVALTLLLTALYVKVLSIVLKPIHKACES